MAPGDEKNQSGAPIEPAVFFQRQKHERKDSYVVDRIVLVRFKVMLKA